MPYAQAEVKLYDDGSIALISYVTNVASIVNGWVTVHGLYSMTTRKHLGAFAKEYCRTTYHTLKKCYNENLQYNIDTKEFYNNSTGEVWTE